MIQDILFDPDNTLYPPQVGLMGELLGRLPHPIPLAANDASPRPW